MSLALVHSAGRRLKIAGHENAGHENRRHETIVYLLCIYRVLVRNALITVACFIGFYVGPDVFLLLSLRLQDYKENCHHRYR